MPSDNLLDDLTYICTDTPWADIRLLVAFLGRLMTRPGAVPAVRDVAGSVGTDVAFEPPSPR